MTTITIPVSDDRLAQLQALAERVGLPLEDVARIGLEEWLDRSRGEFDAAARYVLEKNAELYRRLA